MDAQILEATKQKENIRILLEEKKIAEEVRKNIEEENRQLKNKILKHFLFEEHLKEADLYCFFYTDG